MNSETNLPPLQSRTFKVNRFHQHFTPLRSRKNTSLVFKLSDLVFSQQNIETSQISQHVRYSPNFYFSLCICSICPPLVSRKVSSSIRSCISLQNGGRSSLSVDAVACRSLYGFTREHLRRIFHTVVCGMLSSWIALPVDLEGLCWKSTLTCSTCSSETPGRPELFQSRKQPCFSNFQHHFVMLL